MAELKRQKEKLEEKIMEQYKRYDPVKKKYVQKNMDKLSTPVDIL